MEVLLLIALGLFLVTTPIWALVWFLKLSGRIKRLEALHPDELAKQREEEQRAYEAMYAVPQTEYVEQKIEKVKEEQKEDIVIVSDTPKEKKKDPFSWEDFFTRKFFSILGITSIVLAIGFFSMWAFANGWVGPKGRIAIGVLASLILLVGGEMMRGKYPKFSPVISSAGIAGLLIVTYVAQHVYDFLDPLQGFGLYVLEVATGLVLALRYKARVLGNFSIIGGLLAPILMGGDPLPLMLLVYLLILSVAGFVIALHQKWSEILIILLIGVFGLEWMVFDTSLEWVKGNAVLFLGLILAMHVLIGSGGVVRMIREKVQQKMDGSDIPEKQIFEMLLFVGALLSVNFLAYEVFGVVQWGHFGFFVLAQGAVLYGLSEYLQKKKLLLMRNMATGGAMIALILATIWEIGSENTLALSIALSLEGLLLIIAGQSIGERWFTLFGRVATLVGSFYIFDIDSLWGAAVALVLYWVPTLISLRSFEKDWEKVIGVGALGWGILQMFIWDFDRLERVLDEPLHFVLFSLPASVACAMAYVPFVKSSVTRRIMALLTMIVLMVVFWIFIAAEWSRSDWGPHLITLLIMLVSSFSVLASFFVIESKKQSIGNGVKMFALYTTLSLTTLSILLWGGEMLLEPWRTFLWILWGGVLLITGIYQHWNRFRFFGIAMMLLIIGKLYFVDVWQWEIGVRVIAFLALGGALLSISFLYQKKLK